MQETGFHSWGFVIYRGYYEDEDTWKRYLKAMERAIHEWLVFCGREDLLSQYLRWTIIEDEALATATIPEIRERFSRWCSKRSLARDGKGAAHPFVPESIPRFMYCIYVDAACVDLLDAYEEWVEGGKFDGIAYLPMILIDKDCDTGGEGRDGFPEVDGWTREYVGWMFMDVGSIPESYNTLGKMGLRTSGRYARPPLIYPGHQAGFVMPGWEEDVEESHSVWE